MSSAAELLFAQHREPVFRYLCRAIGAREDARDLTQDVFLRVSRHGVPEIPALALRAWVFTIARNIALDYHRRTHRQPATTAGTVEVPAAASQDTALALSEALTTLADLDRDVFLMREVAGLHYDEIAVACGITADAVRARIHRARLALRNQLAAPIATHRLGPLRQWNEKD